MMLAWRSGAKLRHIIRIDPVFPWPSLHHGRENLRAWSEEHTRRRLRYGDAGPWRLPGPLLSSVREDGDARLRVWPTDSASAPRIWTAGDDVWRPTFEQLADWVGHDLMCEVRVQFMPGGEAFVQEGTAPSLYGRPGYYGWRKGEHEPVEHVHAARISDAIIRKRINTLAIMPREELVQLQIAIQQHLERGVT